MADIQLKKVIKRFGKLETIHGIDLQVEDGEFVVFVGPSGCGKSTLLRLIAGLESISDGDIYIGQDLVNQKDPSERGVAMVFQSYALYPHLSVEQNMGFGLRMNGHPKDKVNKLVAEAAEVLQISHLLERKPKELSGGQRQRVAIGRAIVRDPKVFLFDEPLSNLDAELRVDMRIEISKLHKKLKTTMIYVTHDQVEAMTLADKIVVLKDGNIEQVGTPMDLYHRPANQFVAGFIGSPKMNFIPARVEQVNGDHVTLSTLDKQQLLIVINTANVHPGQGVKLGIRPEHLEVEGEGDVRFRFQCDLVERLGNSTYMFGQACGVEHFKVHLPRDRELSEKNDNFNLTFNSNECHLFDKDGVRI
ncbi:ABC transporter ATP-binding protein [Agarivorans sp. QJM3NY_29]|uniref:ABC transporter ATP-binding protein n=1 Tax=unclassified Agarivorans TaxID=2636026 RepID=UPI003D7CB807